MDSDKTEYNVGATDKGSEANQIPETGKLVDIKITSEPIALNVMVQFLTLAHKRGSFSLDESAKIWECISMFIKKDM